MMSANEDSIVQHRHRHCTDSLSFGFCCKPDEDKLPATRPDDKPFTHTNLK